MIVINFLFLSFIFLSSSWSPRLDGSVVKSLAEELLVYVVVFHAYVIVIVVIVVVVVVDVAANNIIRC